MARPRQVTDEEILEAVRTCVFEQGPSVSTVYIAERLGVSQATLFKRFGDKSNLMLKALVPDARPGFLDLVESGPVSEASAQEDLVEIGVAALAHFRVVMPRIMALRQAGFEPKVLIGQFDVPPPVLVMSGLTAWFERANERGWMKCQDSLSMAMAFMGSLHVRVFFDILMAQKLGDVRKSHSNGDRIHVETLVNNLWWGLKPTGGTE